MRSVDVMLCYLGLEDPKFLLLKMGITSVGVCTIGRGESNHEIVLIHLVYRFPRHL